MELVCVWTVYTRNLLPNNNLADFVFDNLSTESKLGTPEFNDSWAIEWNPFNIWSIKIKALRIQSWIGSNTLNYIIIWSISTRSYLKQVAMTTCKETFSEIMIQNTSLDFSLRKLAKGRLETKSPRHVQGSFGARFRETTLLPLP